MPRALIRPFALRATRSLLVAALALAGLTCRDNSPLGPGLPSRASLALVPHFETTPGGPVVQLHHARVQVYRMPVADGATAVADVTANFSGNDALTLDIEVDIFGASSDFLYKITAMDAAGNIIYAATDSVTVFVGAAPEEPEVATLHWATADTLVRSLRVLPRDTVITANEPFTFGVVAKKADSSVVVASVGWVSRDESVLHMDQATGTATALSQFANVWIVATMGTGLQDSTLVSATQPVTSVVVNPNSATLFVAATQQLAAQVSAAGGVPLPTRPVHWTSSNAAVATVSSTGLVTAVSVGSATISATSGGVTGTSTITVARKIPVITWTTPADITFGTALSATQLNANAVFNSASVPGTFTYLPVAGTVLNAGSALPLAVTFTPTDGAVFAGATGGTTINVLKANQLITFAALPDHVFGEADFTVSATVSSGLAVSFAASGACTITGNTVHLTGSGTCTITASQPGDANRNAATAVARTFNVGKAALSIALSSATGVFGGTASLTATVTAGGAPLAGKTIAFGLNGTVVGSAITNASGVASIASASLVGINAGTYPGAVAPPSGVAAKFAGDANFNLSESVNTLVVTQATATLALGPLTFTYDGSAKPVSVTTAPVGLTGVTITYNGLAAVPVNAGSYSVVASLTNQNYQAANATGTEVIGQASQTITFGALSGRLLGDPAFTVSATSTSGLAVTFDAFGSCTVAGDQVSLVAEGACTISASQAGNTNYAAAAVVSQSFNVGPRPVATVEISPPSAMVQTGQTVLYSATVKAANDEVLTGRVIDWSTGNTDVATVDNGVVTGVSPGQTTVTATVEGKSATATVEVQPPPILIDSTRIVSLDGDTLFSIGVRRLLAIKSFKGSAQVPGVYTWSSDNSEVVTVDGFGTATAIGNGTATVIATESGGTADTLEMVVVQKLARIAIFPTYVKLVPSETFLLSVSGYDALDNQMQIGAQVSWYARDGYIAEVDPVTGEVTGLEPGNETIVAEAGDLEARVLVEVGTRVKSVVVTPVTGTGIFDALGEMQTFTAIAYDADNKPMPGVVVEWQSLNESVVRPTGEDGATVAVTSGINGSTVLRATVQGIHGDAAVTVSQRLDHLVISPAAVTIDVGGVAVLMAQGFDRLDRPMNVDPNEISWSSGRESEVSIQDPRSGVVLGVSTTSSPVPVTAMVAQGGNIQTSVGVTVASAAGALSFGAPQLSIGKGQRIPVTVYLNRKYGSSLTVALSVSDAAIAQWESSTLDFAPNQTSAIQYIVGRQAGTTTIFANDLGDNFVDVTAILAVQPVASLQNLYTSEMNAGEEHPNKIYLNDPAPAGGTWITFEYSTPGVASVFPERAFIPAGHVAADVVIRGVAEGTTTVTPVMPGITGRPSPWITVYPAILGIQIPEVVRYIGVGQWEFGAPNLYQGGDNAVRARAAKAMQQAAARTGAVKQGAAGSDDDRRVPARIPTGIGQWANGFYSGACSGYYGGEGVNDKQGAFEVGGYYGITAADYCIRISTDPDPEFPVLLTSSNPGALLVEDQVVIDNSYEGFAVAAVGTGSSTVTASAPGWTSGEIPVVVTTPRLTVVEGYGEGYDVNADSITLRDYMGANIYMEVGDSLGTPHPLINSLRVRISTSDASVFTVDDSVLVIDAGEFDGNDYMYLTPVGAGTAWLRFQSDGHMGDSVQVTVPKRGLLVPRVTYVGTGQYGQFDIGFRRPEENNEVTVTIASLTDTATAAVDAQVTFDGQNTNVGVRGYVPGSTDFVVTSEGFDPETVTVVVTTPRFLLENGDGIENYIGQTNFQALYLVDSLYNQRAPIEPVLATLRSLDPGIVTVTDEVLVDYYYASGLEFTIVGEGTTWVIIEAPGYRPDTVTVIGVRPKLNISHEALDVGVATTQANYYYYRPSISIPVPAGPEGLVMNFRHLTPGLTTLDHTQMVIASGYYGGENFTVTGEMVGVDTIIVEDAAGYFAPDTIYINVTPTKIAIMGEDSVTVSSANSGNLPYQLNITDQYYGYATFGKTITFDVISSDPEVIGVETPSVNGVMNATYTSFSLFVVGAGTAQVIISDRSGQIAPDTVFITVTAPKIISYYNNVTVGMRQRAVNAGYVTSELNQETPITVWLTSSDPNVASVPASVTVPGFSSVNFNVTGGDTIGTVRIRMEADGYAPAFMDVEVGRPRIGVSLTTYSVANNSEGMYVFVTDQYGNEREPIEDVTVTLTSSDPSVAEIDASEFTILASCNEVCPESPVIFYKKAGRSIFTARDSRYPAYQYGYQPYVDTIRVSKPALQLQSLNYYGYTYVGTTQQDSLLLTLESSASSSMTILLSSSDPTVVRVPPSVTIESGESSVMVPVFGGGRLDYGASVFARADGYVTAETYVYVRRGALEIQPLANFYVGQPAYVSITTRDPFEQYYNRGNSAVTTPQTFNLVGDPAVVKFYAVGSMTPITSVTIPAGEFEGLFLVEAQSTGFLSFGTTGNDAFDDASYSSSGEYSQAVTVDIRASSPTTFSPQNINVLTNGTVSWNNTSGLDHSIIFTPVAGQPADVGTFSSGSTASTVTSLTPGTYAYHCGIHGAAMSGTVIVH